MQSILFCVKLMGDHPDPHVRPHSFPSRRSSERVVSGAAPGEQADQHRAGQRGVQVLADEHHWPPAGAPVWPLPACTPTCTCLIWLMPPATWRSEEHTSELQSLMRISYAVFCMHKKKKHIHKRQTTIKAAH